MTIFSIETGTPVELEFAGHRLEGVVEDVRWRPSFNAPTEEIVVDADGTRITTGRTHVRPQ